MKEHDLFLVDDRIVPEMPRVLGKQWLSTKKSPIPVTLKRADLKAELERAISSTYLRINKGTSVAIKIGSLASHTPEQLHDNLLAAVSYLAVRLPGGWDNVQSLHIKSTTSTSLPLWSCSIDDGAEGSSGGRFFVPEANNEEIEAKKKAKAEKDERIREKRLRRLENAARRIAEENGQQEDDESDEDTEAVDGEPVEGEDQEVEEIDETPAAKPASASKKEKTKTSKLDDSPAKSERKKVSSTSKKMKGLDSVKGLPRKTKKA